MAHTDFPRLTNCLPPDSTTYYLPPDADQSIACQ